MRKYTALFNLHWRDFRRGRKQFRARMKETFGDNWTEEYVELTKESSPPKITSFVKALDEELEAEEELDRQKENAI